MRCTTRQLCHMLSSRVHCCLLQALWEQGKRAIPAGTCPTVGIGGHILGAIHGSCCMSCWITGWGPCRRLQPGNED